MTAVEAPAGQVQRCARHACAARCSLLRQPPCWRRCCASRSGRGRSTTTRSTRSSGGASSPTATRPTTPAASCRPPRIPLSTLTGALLSPLGTHADGGLLVLAFLGLGALGRLAFATGRRLAGAGARAAAAALVLTRDTTLFYGGLRARLTSA
jgi:hypothetical protein